MLRSKYPLDDVLDFVMGSLAVKVNGVLGVWILVGKSLPVRLYDGLDFLEGDLLKLIPVRRVIDVCELYGIVGPEDEGEHRERQQSIRPHVEVGAQAIRTQLSVARAKQPRQMSPLVCKLSHEKAGAIPEDVVRHCGQHLFPDTLWNGVRHCGRIAISPR